MSTANFYVLTDPLRSERGLKEETHPATRLIVTAAKTEAEPEARLWKICTETASPRLGVIESITFIFFGVLALGALTFCFSELLQLVNSGALDQAVRALLMR